MEALDRADDFGLDWNNWSDRTDGFHDPERF